MKKLLAILTLAAPLALLAQPANTAPAVGETNNVTFLARWQRVTNIVDMNLSDEGVPKVHIGHTHTYWRTNVVSRQLVYDGRVGTNTVRGAVLKSVVVKQFAESYTVPQVPVVTGTIDEIVETP